MFIFGEYTCAYIYVNYAHKSGKINMYSYKKVVNCWCKFIIFKVGNFLLFQSLVQSFTICIKWYNTTSKYIL